MELSSLSQNIVPVRFDHGSEYVELQVNIDAFTPEFFRELSQRMTGRIKTLEAQAKKKGRKKEEGLFLVEASALELEREITVEFLVPHVLKGWDVTDNGVPVAPTREVLNKLPPRMIKDMLSACVEASKTVKKRVESETEETLESTGGGSMALRAV